MKLSDGWGAHQRLSVGAKCHGPQHPPPVSAPAERLARCCPLSSSAVSTGETNYHPLSSRRGGLISHRPATPHCPRWPRVAPGSHAAARRHRPVTGTGRAGQPGALRAGGRRAPGASRPPEELRRALRTGGAPSAQFFPHPSSAARPSRRRGSPPPRPAARGARPPPGEGLGLGGGAAGARFRGPPAGGGGARGAVTSARACGAASAQSPASGIRLPASPPFTPSPRGPLSGPFPKHRQLQAAGAPSLPLRRLGPSSPAWKAGQTLGTRGDGRGRPENGLVY